MGGDRRSAGLPGEGGCWEQGLHLVIRQEQDVSEEVVKTNPRSSLPRLHKVTKSRACTAELQQWFCPAALHCRLFLPSPQAPRMPGALW